MKMRTFTCLIPSVFLALIFQAGQARAQLVYPVTQKVSQADNFFGTRVEDPYRWLETDTAASTRSWVKTEQQFTENYLAKIPFRPALKKQLTSLMNYPRFYNGFRAGEYIFFTKNNGLQNQSVFYVQKGLKGIPKVFIDPNTLSADGTVSLVLDAASNNKKYLAYHINKNGSDWSATYIMDIEANKQLPDSINWMRGGGVAWAGNGFYYTRYPEPAKGMALTAVPVNPKIYYHKLGDDQSKDTFVYDDAAHPTMIIEPSTTEDESFLIVYRIPGTNGFEVIGKKRTVKEAPFKLLFKGYEYQTTVLDNTGDQLLVKTNEGAGNFRIIRVNFNHPEKASWKTVIGEKKEKLESVSIAGGKIITTYLQDASSKVYQHTLQGKQEFEVTLPGIGSAHGFGGYRNDKTLFYNFTSYTYPPSVFSYEIKTGKSTIFKQSVSSLKLGEYETQQVFFTSKDGTKVPMFLVHKKGIKLDGTHPTLLYAYGGFDISLTPSFNPTAYLLLQNNGIFAVANIRGGGEYGENWHKAGMFEKKQTVFNDFIAAAEYLIEKKYTSSPKLAVMGGSNGGLLIGAVLTQRPDLFKVAIPEVGVMDMLRFQKFTSGVYWTSEYGSSDTLANFPYLYKYSPLHNIKSNIAYPATLVMTADHDDRVVPMHSFKFGATLQEKQTGANPVLIRISINQGHGASGSSLAKNIEDNTDIYSFLFYTMGITPVFN